MKIPLSAVHPGSLIACDMTGKPYPEQNEDIFMQPERVKFREEHITGWKDGQPVYDTPENRHIGEAGR